MISANSSFIEDDESIQSPTEKDAREEDSEYSAESHSEKNDQPTINEVSFFARIKFFLKSFLLSLFRLFLGQSYR